MDNNPTINYKEILGEIGAQIQLRKSLLMKRVLLISWPFILLVIIAYVINTMYNFESLPKEERFKYVVVILIYVLVASIYSTIIRYIFNIEKRVWIDSYFDKRNLKSNESWKIAYKLFWPFFVFRIKLWLQYYFVPIAVVIVAFGLAIRVFVPIFNSSSGFENILIGSIILFVVFVVCLVVYGYYLKTKLRYTYFIFLDKFGTGKTYKSMIDEMNQLNNISKTETFKKSLIFSIGADSVDGIAKIAVGTISYGLSQLGDSGKLLGGILRVYGEEASRQTTDLANISAQYVLYRFARKQAHGNEQEINENVYRLLNS